ncbi:DUF6438 domain-containing protein [Pontibacter ruber]|uniref:DUF6438 domain-containing protein n=1 Tax=Pontibacter ruber TaxID=1343895 RepID=A0ABW5D168_9BACT|nr:DUF6438 domain-containing protein [Pontibacter ruber]
MKQKNAQVFLIFQKTPCFGICPSYEATIYENGSITYVGWEHVPLKDTVELHLSAPEVKSLQEEVKQLNYSELQDAYLTQWSDMPSTYSTFYANGKEVKRVKHQEGGPEKLLQFQEHLHKRIMDLVEAEAIRRLPKE